MESKFEEKDNIIRSKSFDFSVRIVNLYKVLYYERNEKTPSKQLLRSGTSIGANIEEGIAAFSKKEFIYKLQISYKEANESFYWIKLLHRTDYIKDVEFESLKLNLEEIIRLLTSIIKSSKLNS
ncbi:four helix bundle protein [Chryseobacterium manosquense]|uniref:Four helix bundle protein n=1 Tax=Chryseobacterium manosquense TaxID=2754694 RepID=A0A7H1DTY0_9FLAO|nr:four helix bundle protein [Chryseobacterium manosquense]QNS40438.1 four helix bundle protein [Chryseobacterium manosquense]